jgi:hypothetical protein
MVMYLSGSEFFYSLSTGLDLYIFLQSPGGYQVLKFGRPIEILLARESHKYPGFCKITF